MQLNLTIMIEKLVSHQNNFEHCWPDISSVPVFKTNMVKKSLLHAEFRCKIINLKCNCERNGHKFKQASRGKKSMRSCDVLWGLINGEVSGSSLTLKDADHIHCCEVWNMSLNVYHLITVLLSMDLLLLLFLFWALLLGWGKNEKKKKKGKTTMAQLHHRHLPQRQRKPACQTGSLKYKYAEFLLQLPPLLPLCDQSTSHSPAAALRLPKILSRNKKSVIYCQHLAGDCSSI